MAERWNVKQVARVIGKTPRTVWRWVKKGWLPKPCGSIGISPVWDKDALLAQFTADTTTVSLLFRDHGGKATLLEEKMGKPSRCFTGLEVLRMRTPIIYAWVRDGEVLYIGMSIRGLERPFSRLHHRLIDMEVSDFLFVWQCSSVKDLEALEKKLIAELKPKFNGPKIVKTVHSDTNVPQSA